MRAPNYCLLPIAAIHLIAAPLPALAADGLLRASPAIIDICLDLKRTPAVCTCSAAKLQSSVQQDAFEHYDAVGAAYLQLKREGKRRRHAWSLAVSERAQATGEQVAQLTEKMSVAADDHLLAIQACGQQ